MPVASIAEAIDFVNARYVYFVFDGFQVSRSARRDRPLVIYAFTENSEVKQESGWFTKSNVISLIRTLVLETTVSGNIVFNDTFQQLAGQFFRHAVCSDVYAFIYSQ